MIEQRLTWCLNYYCTDSQHSSSRPITRAKYRKLADNRDRHMYTRSRIGVTPPPHDKDTQSELMHLSTEVEFALDGKMHTWYMIPRPNRTYQRKIQNCGGSRELNFIYEFRGGNYRFKGSLHHYLSKFHCTEFYYLPEALYMNLSISFYLFKNNLFVLVIAQTNNVASRWCL